MVRKEKYITDSNERLYIYLRRGKSHTREFEKVNRDDSDLMVTVELKNQATKKVRLHVTDTIKVNICTC